MMILKQELEKKNLEIKQLENKANSRRENTSRIFLDKSQITGKNSKYSSKMVINIENQTEMFLKNINELETKLARTKNQNKILFNNLLDLKEKHQEEISILYTTLTKSNSFKF